MSQEHKVPFVSARHDSGQGATWDRRQHWAEWAGFPNPHCGLAAAEAGHQVPSSHGPKTRCLSVRPHRGFLLPQSYPTKCPSPGPLPWNGEVERGRLTKRETGVGGVDISRACGFVAKSQEPAEKLCLVLCCSAASPRPLGRGDRDRGESYLSSVAGDKPQKEGAKPKTPKGGGSNAPI